MATTTTNQRAFDAVPPLGALNSVRSPHSTTTLTVRAAHLTDDCRGVWLVPAAVDAAGRWSRLSNPPGLRPQRATQALTPDADGFCRCTLTVDFSQFPGADHVLLLFITAPHRPVTVYMREIVHISLESPLAAEPAPTTAPTPIPIPIPIPTPAAPPADPDADHFIAIEAAFAEQADGASRELTRADVPRPV